MRKQLLILLIPVLFACQPKTPTTTDEVIDYSVQKLLAAVDEVPEGTYPIRSKGMGVWENTPPTTWTSGFFPGMLWEGYELSGNKALYDAAIIRTEGLEDQQFNTHTHDVGFMMFCSYGRAYEETGNEAYKAILLQTAESLASRFHPNVGAIQSWDGDYQVIMDNMMNLELLFWAAKNGGDQRYYDIAKAHAYKTMEEHIREDGGAFHVVHYDTTTGAVTRKRTEQGFADWSSWARGQAWGIYGFTMTYRETKDEVFLQTAEKLTRYYMDHLPDDYIPFWDLNLPEDEPRRFKDSSAGAIVLSAFLELRNYVDDPAMYDEYIELIKDSIVKNYLSYGTNASGILVHGAYNANRDNPHDWDSSTSWGDYYFLEALMRYKEYKKS